LHESSSRREKAFIKVNCAAIPKDLMESELFGYERGAFTGAEQRKKGRFDMAEGGTLFLDEIGDMPLGVQGKLLRFLENQKFMRVGGSEKISVDVRLVCATLRPLEDEVQARRFRGDLYYRIQGIQLRVPPLRERQEDLAPLIQQLLAQLAARHDLTAPKLTRSALAQLRRHSWPGNIRELRNVLELAVLLRAGRRVRVEDLPASLRAASRADPGPLPPVSRGTSVAVPLDQPLRSSIAQIIEATLQLEQGNQSRAARRLGISSRTIQRHLSASTPR
jgi:DNA-binding NtrC family response regulator